jgi:hypothetical protein
MVRNGFLEVLHKVDFQDSFAVVCAMVLSTLHLGDSYRFLITELFLDDLQVLQLILKLFNLCQLFISMTATAHQGVTP